MSKKILLVEDCDKNRLLIKDVLNYYSYEVVEAINGEKGIETAKEYKPDLILMDMQMPVMDGFTALKILKNDPDTKHMKIIAITSYVMKGDKERILEAGADDYIAKPIDVREMLEIVKRHLLSSEDI